MVGSEFSPVSPLPQLADTQRAGRNEGAFQTAIDRTKNEHTERGGAPTDPATPRKPVSGISGVIDDAVASVGQNLVSMDEAGKVIADTMTRPEVQSLPTSVKGELENALWDAHKTANRLPMSRDDAKRNLATLEGHIKTLDGMVKRGQLAPQALHGLKAFASHYRTLIQDLDGGAATGAQPKASGPLHAQQAVAVPGSDDVLNAVTKVLEDHEGANRMLKEGLEGFKAALAAKEHNPLIASDLGTAAIKTIEGVFDMLAHDNFEGAREVAEVLEQVASVFKLPSSVFGIVNTALKVTTGKDLAGKSVHGEDRLKPLWDIPGQLKDIADFGKLFEPLSKAFADLSKALSERLGSANPVMVGVSISYEEFKFLLKNVYLPAKQTLTDGLTREYLGGDPEQLKRDVQAIHITPRNAAEVVQQLQGLFKNGGIASMPNMSPAAAWHNFLWAHLSPHDRDMIKRVNSAPDRNAPAIRIWTEGYARTLQQLAVQFIDHEVAQAHGH